MVTGPELNRLYLEQVEQMGIEITERQVTSRWIESMIVNKKNRTE